jgi:proteic killer suppression protein
MLKSFLHKGLAELWSTGRSAKVDAKMHSRLLVRLDALDAAARPADVNIPGFDFHRLHGFDPDRYSVHVNGPWCLTFSFDGADVVRVDFEQYH